MSTVRDLLKNKPGDLWTVSPGDSVYRALELMAERDIGAVLVVEAERLVGIFTERDYARKVILRGISSRDAIVRDLMTEAVLYVRPGQKLEECMALMTQKRVRHLPVIDDDGELIGMISIGDVVKKVISEHEFMIHQLENYITGGRL